MTTFAAEPATDATYELAEGVLWDDRAGVVRWVDIWKGRVLSGSVRNPRRPHVVVPVTRWPGSTTTPSWHHHENEAHA